MDESESYISDFEPLEKPEKQQSPKMGKSKPQLLADIPEIESRRTMLTNHTTMSNY